MFELIVFLLLLSTTLVQCSQIPFIQNVTLVPRYQWNSTTISNQTYQTCLCASQPSFVAFNWFPNNTCQLFYTFPITYKIQSTSLARLYFPKGILPNASQCCMPDLNYLLSKLINGTWIYVNVTNPRNLVLDNNGYLVTVELNPPYLNRYNSQNLTMISRSSLGSSSTYAMSVTLFNNYYFIGLISSPIMVIDSRNLTFVYNITSSYIQNLRAVLFINNGSTMVMSNFNNNSLIYFRRANNSLFNYAFTYRQGVNYPQPHGLIGSNDSFFYATSYPTNSIYSYSVVQNSSSWLEKLIINTNSNTSTTGGTFMTIDECGRYWFSIEMNFIEIFDSFGNWIGNFSLGNAKIMDLLIADNYVMYLSDSRTIGTRILRIDPHIVC